MDNVEYLNYLMLAHSGVGVSQSAQNPLPGTCSLTICIVAKLDVCGFDLFEIFDCNVLKISCSII